MPNYEMLSGRGKNLTFSKAAPFLRVAETLGGDGESPASKSSTDVAAEIHKNSGASQSSPRSRSRTENGSIAWNFCAGEALTGRRKWRCRSCSLNVRAARLSDQRAGPSCTGDRGCTQELVDVVGKLRAIVWLGNKRRIQPTAE